MLCTDLLNQLTGHRHRLFNIRPLATFDTKSHGHGCLLRVLTFHLDVDAGLLADVTDILSTFSKHRPTQRETGISNSI